MAKDKKKKKNDKGGKTKSAGAKMRKRLREISQNPVVVDVVAATLVAAASALKDSKRAHQLAANAGDELEKLAHDGAERGNAMWQLAQEVGRRALDSLIGEETKAAKTPKAAKKPKAAKTPKAARVSKPMKAKPSPKSGRKTK
jgi:hypothetical protein